MDKQPNEPDSPEPTLFDTLSDAQPPQAGTLAPTDTVAAAGESDPAPAEPAPGAAAQVADEPLVTPSVATPEPSEPPMEMVAAPAEASDPLTGPAVVMTDVPGCIQQVVAPSPSAPSLTLPQGRGDEEPSGRHRITDAPDMPTAPAHQATQPNTAEPPASPSHQATQVPAVAIPVAPTAETAMIGEPVPTPSPDTQTPGRPGEVAAPTPVAQTSSREVEAQTEHIASAPVPPASPAEPPRPTAKPQRPTGAWWTIPMICAGLAMVACALIVGQVEINRQVAWQRNKLKIDLEYLQKQIQQNEESLKSIQTDPTMAEYLAQRQTGQVREGSAILDVPGLPHQNDRNPFHLTTIPPPKPLAPYRPRADLLTVLFADPQHALWAIGIGLMLVAAGLVLGGPDEAAEDQK